MIIPPADWPESVEIILGPNIKPLPVAKPLGEELAGPVLIKVGDNISTDHIMPAGAKILPLRSNIPAISEYVFTYVDHDFVKRAKAAGGGFIAGGNNYGQGSSREHAALAPMYLGVKAVLAKAFARIHWANLVNFGILPLVFKDANGYEGLKRDDKLEIHGVREALVAGAALTVRNVTQGYDFPVHYTLSERQRHILLAGGLLNYVKQL